MKMRILLIGIALIMVSLLISSCGGVNYRSYAGSYSENGNYRFIELKANKSFTWYHPFHNAAYIGVQKIWGTYEINGDKITFSLPRKIYQNSGNTPDVSKSNDQRTKVQLKIQDGTISGGLSAEQPNGSSSIESGIVIRDSNSTDLYVKK